MSKKILSLKDCEYHTDYQKMIANYPTESKVYELFRNNLVYTVLYNATYRWFDLGKKPVLSNVKCSSCKNKTKPIYQVWIHSAYCPDRTISYDDYERREVLQRAYMLLCTGCFRTICQNCEIPYKMYSSILLWDSLQFRDIYDHGNSHDHGQGKAHFVELLSKNKFIKSEYEEGVL